MYTENLKNQKNAPDGSKGDALNQPGLKEMTLKAIDITHKRGGDKGFFIMSEAASIDKMMHVLDYDRALGELLELDDTIRATIAKLKALGIYDETLIIVTADHGTLIITSYPSNASKLQSALTNKHAGHGFDVTGGVDTKYLREQQDQRKKRNAVGVYQNSGLSQYVTGNLTYGTGVHFPANWDPRYTLQQGVVTFPDHREDYVVHKSGVRLPAVNSTAKGDNYITNPKDNTDGFEVSGTLNLPEAQGVHSLTDVPVFAVGPGSELFGGVYNNIDIFFKIAQNLGLAQ